jgi:hypothetical protein
VDDSVLHFREDLDVEVAVDRLMYVYQYMNASGVLEFRYDNTGQIRKLKLLTYPHHKHIGENGEVTASSGPELGKILDEIESGMKLP